MIISPKHAIAFLPIENANSEVFEEALVNDDEYVEYVGNNKYEYVTPTDEDYRVVISRRNAKDRLYSFYKFMESSTMLYGHGDLYNTFEEFLNFINAKAYLPFIDDPTASLYAPEYKRVGGILTKFPIPQRAREVTDWSKMYLEYGHYVTQVDELTGLTVTETVEGTIDPGDDFAEANALANLYDWGIQTT